MPTANQFSLPVPTGAVDPILLPNELLLQRFSRRRITWKPVPADPTLNYSNIPQHVTGPSDHENGHPTSSHLTTASVGIHGLSSRPLSAPATSPTAAAVPSSPLSQSPPFTIRPSVPSPQPSRPRRGSNRFWGLFSKSGSPLSSDSDSDQVPSTTPSPNDLRPSVDASPVDYSPHYISSPSTLGVIYVTSQRVILVPSNSNSEGFYFDISRILMMEVSTFQDRNDRVYFVCHVNDSPFLSTSSPPTHKLFGMSFLTKNRADAFCQLIANIKLVHLIKANFPPRYTSLTGCSNTPNLFTEPSSLLLSDDHGKDPELLCSSLSLCSPIDSHASVSSQGSDAKSLISESGSTSIMTPVSSAISSNCASCDNCSSSPPSSFVLEDDWAFSDQCLPTYEESELALKKYLMSQNLINENDLVDTNCWTLDNLNLLARASTLAAPYTTTNDNGQAGLANHSPLFTSRQRPSANSPSNCRYLNGSGVNRVSVSNGPTRAEPLFDNASYILPYSWF
ncbi:hypothetical protein NADFUDRAFT_46644 [Nadsonia fulvescens var. elongata DSM 6958]|uniref:Uncharacterized protein n=1 Tax=Nadsonia fulvescens var. elongata DSM 6958 TaxID=857566 RepID=A0A1E3PLF0_9ASCO|nr:hypothetical protein NADFUDRAFT_46644 [Nadsonia fulvescens var. elongata DSM 6958]